MKIDMSKVWKARRLISQGVSVKEIAEKLGMSEASVRSYTKAERATIKAKKDNEGIAIMF